MRYNKTMISTLKEAPSDAISPSHIFLVRAGYIRQVASGIFSLLPLGVRVIQKITAIIRDELHKAEAQEVLLPMVHPASLWQESGRWELYGPELLRFQDRKKMDFVLSPTAEEAMVSLVRSEIKSYKKLPINLFQIQDKFRDEMRPRAGLLRGREFVMKDGYSFHASSEDAKREYKAMYDAYSHIFARCGLDFRAVDADTGAIGGTLSHEFQVLADTGEDHIVSCSNCNYAANVEKAVLSVPHSTVDLLTDAKPSLVHTPHVKSISEVCTFFTVPESGVLKTLVYMADEQPIGVVIRGDRSLNEPKLKAYLQVSTLVAASTEQIIQHLGISPGCLGPINLSIPLYADHEVTQGEYIAGANQPDYHLKHVRWNSDFQATLVDVRIAQLGDLCGMCKKGTYKEHKGIEVGHVFFLGTKYSKPLGCNFLDKEGVSHPMIMGTYGIGVTRIMAACIEQHHDSQGIIWPMSLAPYQVVLVPLGKEVELIEATESIHKQLQKNSIEVLLDDRDERPGVKFNDADLLGIPIRITIGKKSLAENQVEFKLRKNKEIQSIPIDEIVSSIQACIQKELSQ